MKLEEGKTYAFDALKTIELPGGSVNLMLGGPDGRKYLLPLEYYHGYVLNAPGAVRCRVDKINCSGKVFLEPLHPFYIEGESYDFIVDGIKEYIDEKGQKSEQVTIKDLMGNHAVAPLELLNSRPEAGEKVRLRIDRISKGKLRFRHKTDTGELVSLEEGKSYEFRITGIVAGPEDDKYYSAVDINGDDHLLAVRYYSHYGFEPGIVFRGKVVRYSSGSRKSIEPENPWFHPGDVMLVTVASCSSLETGEGFLAEVFDRNGFSHTLVLDKYPEVNNLICKVVKIRKGRPVLERVEE
ncbi:MAG: hypothetical protein MUP53_00160 [Bacteroidales bacterium]|nr:hypothetical protein [Bacteroidales bacterium]